MIHNLMLKGYSTNPVLLDGRSYQMDGVSEHIVFGDNSSFAFGANTAFSVVFWALVTDAVGNDPFVHKYKTTSFRGWIIRQIAGRVEMYIRNGSKSMRKRAVPVLSANTWTHIGVVKTNSSSTSGCTIYINGVEVAGESVSNNLSGSIANTEQLKVGRRSTNYMGGNLDEMAVFSYALTSADVSGIYTSANNIPSKNPLLWIRAEGDAAGTDNVIDHSGNANHGTFVNMDSSNLSTDTP